VNLLQPQDRRSPGAGDSREAIAARTRLLSAGVGQLILSGFVDRAASLLSTEPIVVDLGSGTGDALALLSRRQAVTAVGIDLSVAAAEQAARRFPGITWAVANADRRLPLLDKSVTLTTSLHARRNPAECARVLRSTGWLLAAVPAPDDLIELREAVQGSAPDRARGDQFVEDHLEHFDLIDRFVLTERHALSGDALRDLLSGTYRGARASLSQRVETLTALDVTLSSDVLVLRVR
jgi:23S rRNA (guanine745-N1)-methyltransferase